MRRMRNKLLLIIMRPFFIYESFLQLVLWKGLFVFDLFSSHKAESENAKKTIKNFYGYAPTKTGALIP